jgi:putative effector of murein hydrolase
VVASLVMMLSGVVMVLAAPLVRWACSEIPFYY